MKRQHLTQDEVDFINAKADEVASKLTRRVAIAVRIREIDEQLHRLDPSKYGKPL